MQEINDRGVPCFVGSCSELYLEKAFTSSAYESSPVPVARELGDTSLMFLVHPTLNEDEMASMVEVAVEVLGSATR